jgi:hypothetical protein
MSVDTRVGGSQKGRVSRPPGQVNERFGEGREWDPSCRGQARCSRLGRAGRTRLVRVRPCMGSERVDCQVRSRAGDGENGIRIRVDVTRYLTGSPVPPGPQGRQSVEVQGVIVDGERYPSRTRETGSGSPRGPGGSRGPLGRPTMGFRTRTRACGEPYVRGATSRSHLGEGATTSALASRDAVARTLLPFTKPSRGRGRIVGDGVPRTFHVERCLGTAGTSPVVGARDRRRSGRGPALCSSGLPPEGDHHLTGTQ